MSKKDSKAKKNTAENKKPAKVRNANMELLRMLSMFMVVVLHALGKGGLLTDMSAPTLSGTMLWFLEALSLSAVNIFVLISGFFLINSTYKTKRLLGLVGQILFYSVVSLGFCGIFGVETGENFNLYLMLRTFFPIHMDVFWFMTAYLMLYILLPVISAGVKNISEDAFKTMLIALLIFECIFKSISPFRFEGDGKGYSFFWFVIVFLTGAYFRLFGFRKLNKPWKGLLLYFSASFMIFLENFVIDNIIARTGHLKEIEGISTEYNHIFVLLAAIGIFSAFLSMKPILGKAHKVITAISPFSLGVYLFHENISARYNWPKWMGFYERFDVNAGLLLLWVLGSCLLVYALGTLVEFIRTKIFAGLKWD